MVPLTGVNQGTVNYQGGKQMSSGDTFNMSGNFSGAILNIKNTLTNTIQTVNGMAQAAPDQKQELAQLIEQLQTALATVPADQAEAAETVAETAKDLVEKAAKDLRPQQPILLEFCRRCCRLQHKLCRPYRS